MHWETRNFMWLALLGCLLYCMVWNRTHCVFEGCWHACTISLALPQSSFHHVVPDPSYQAKSCFLWKTQPKCYPGCNTPVSRAKALELLRWRWGWTKEARLPHLNQQPRICSAGCQHRNLFSGLLDPPCFKKHKKSEFFICYPPFHFFFNFATVFPWN